MLVFLEVNGWKLDRDDDEIAKVFEDLGKRKIDQARFFKWMATFAIPKKQ